MVDKFIWYTAGPAGTWAATPVSKTSKCHAIETTGASPGMCSDWLKSETVDRSEGFEGLRALCSGHILAMYFGALDQL